MGFFALNFRKFLWEFPAFRSAKNEPKTAQVLLSWGVESMNFTLVRNGTCMK